MVAIVFPSTLSGVVHAAPGKSMMQRACALALLNNGETIIRNPGNSKDDIAAINIIQNMGATVKYHDHDLVIKSDGVIRPAHKLQCGESGLAFRMFAAIAALGSVDVVFDGEGSLLHRPMQFMNDVFPKLGVNIQSVHGHLPISIRGPLVVQDITIDGAESSQYLTGLLFAFAKAAKQRVTITVNNLISKPYIDLSIQMLQQFGYRVHQEEYCRFYIEPVAPVQHKIHCTIEADWSNAAFLMVAAAIAGKAGILGPDMHSLQADKEIITVLEHCGANVKILPEGINVSRNTPMRSFMFDATDCPDLFPPLVALAAHCNGISTIRGVSRLYSKESNRAITLADVFMMMGVEINIADDCMYITGTDRIKGASVDSHNDHRIVMAASVAALTADGPVLIKNAAAVNKSYPLFFEHLKKLGAAISFNIE